jgi:hypothetical protein
MRLAIIFIAFIFFGCQKQQQSEKQPLTSATLPDSALTTETDLAKLSSTANSEKPEAIKVDSIAQQLSLVTLKDFEQNGSGRTTAYLLTSYRLSPPIKSQEMIDCMLTLNMSFGIHWRTSQPILLQLKR